MGIRFSSIPKFKYTVPPLVVSDIIYQNQENLANSIKGGYSLRGGREKARKGKEKEGEEILKKKEENPAFPKK